MITLTDEQAREIARLVGGRRAWARLCGGSTELFDAMLAALTPAQPSSPAAVLVVGQDVDVSQRIEEIAEAGDRIVVGKGDKGYPARPAGLIAARAHLEALQELASIPEEMTDDAQRIVSRALAAQPSAHASGWEDPPNKVSVGRLLLRRAYHALTMGSAPEEYRLSIAADIEGFDRSIIRGEPIEAPAPEEPAPPASCGHEEAIEVAITSLELAETAAKDGRLTGIELGALKALEVLRGVQPLPPELPRGSDAELLTQLRDIVKGMRETFVHAESCDAFYEDDEPGMIETTIGCDCFLAHVEALERALEHAALSAAAAGEWELDEARIYGQYGYDSKRSRTVVVASTREEPCEQCTARDCDHHRGEDVTAIVTGPTLVQVYRRAKGGDAR